MAVIKIKAGTIGFYAEGDRHVTKSTADKPFECEDTQAAYFVNLGVAEYAEKTEKVGSFESFTVAEEEPQGEEPKETAHLDRAELEKWGYKDLQALAADIGAMPKGKKKGDYIDAIVAVEVIPGDEVETDDEDNELPELSAVDPE